MVESENRMEQTGASLVSFLQRGVTPYHTVEEGICRLKNSGFEEWNPAEEEKLEVGKGYYVPVYGTTLVAFRMPKKQVKAMRIAAAHTDYPCLRLKANPDKKDGSYLRLNVEVYGGPILNTWLDRPLSLAGRVTVCGESVFRPKTVLVDFQKPILTIPNLAIHMNREVNRGVELKPQTDLLPIFALSGDSSFLSQLASLAGVAQEKILDYDLFVYNAEQPSFVGMNEEFLSSPRLDNLTSCESCLYGLTEAAALEDCLQVIALFDNEECGSHSKQGADSMVLLNLLEQLILTAGGSRGEFLRILWSSFLLSLDVAHASHPAHLEKSDPTNPIRLDGGVIIKQECNQRYATDSEAAAVVEGLCRQENIPCQQFFNHSNLRGGSTLGSILSSTLPVHTVDLGIPLLAMHSSRELMATETQTQMNRLLAAYFQ